MLFDKELSKLQVQNLENVPQIKNTKKYECEID